MRCFYTRQQLVLLPQFRLAYQCIIDHIHMSRQTKKEISKSFYRRDNSAKTDSDSDCTLFTCGDPTRYFPVLRTKFNGTWLVTEQFSITGVYPGKALAVYIQRLDSCIVLSLSWTKVRRRYHNFFSMSHTSHTLWPIHDVAKYSSASSEHCQLLNTYLRLKISRPLNFDHCRIMPAQYLILNLKCNLETN